MCQPGDVIEPGTLVNAVPRPPGMGTLDCTVEMFSTNMSQVYVKNRLVCHDKESSALPAPARVCKPGIPANEPRCEACWDINVISKCRAVGLGCGVLFAVGLRGMLGYKRHQ